LAFLLAAIVLFAFAVFSYLAYEGMYFFGFLDNDGKMTNGLTPGNFELIAFTVISGFLIIVILGVLYHIYSFS